MREMLYPSIKDLVKDKEYYFSLCCSDIIFNVLNPFLYHYKIEYYGTISKHILYYIEHN